MTTTKKALEEIDRLRHLRSLGTPDTEIRDRLHLSEPAFWRRVHKMKEIDRKVMLDKFTDDIASEVRIFETRLQRDIMACEGIINKPDSDDANRLEAIRLKTDLSILSMKMHREGPAILNATTRNTLEQKEQQQLGIEYRPAVIHSADTDERSDRTDSEHIT